MNENVIKVIARELNINIDQVKQTLSMLEEGNTVPFIARYRKQQTNGLDEEQILFIQKQYDYQIKLKDRKEAVLKLIQEQGKLTEEIIKSINEAEKLSQVEDLYRPYAQKKKTRAGVAINNGLQPLADWMLSCPLKGSLEEEASKYLNENVKTVKNAIQMAKDIIAEVVSDNAKQRWDFKDEILKTGVLVTKEKKNHEDEKQVYKMYYDYSEKLSTLMNHRVMAVNRAEKEKVITVSIEFNEEELKNRAYNTILKNKDTIVSKELREATDDGCTRLLFPSIEREIRSEFTEKAQNQSIEVFSMNLEKLLLQAPIKGRTVMGFDPGYANGCKLAVVDNTGKMLVVDKIYPFRGKGNDRAIEMAKRKVAKLLKEYHVEIIAIGNGTASRESEQLCAEIIKENHLDTQYAIVSEAGASVWSAQEAAREEFPDMAIEERSAVSIARRLLDPLAELIKIDPKSIGVGQYQHDLPQKALSTRLDEVVMKCVNRTGADLNTASIDLLTHISGLNKGIAKEIINYRNENGRFTNRKQLLKVKKLGPKAYQQCAGFLRIHEGEEPLDETSIHPESYAIAKQIMKLCEISQLGQPDIVFPKDKLNTLDIDTYTLTDIEDAIRSPLRDYREQFAGALLKSDVLEISDLHENDQLMGTVRNVVDFGAFVDIGLHEDGLIHISHMADHKVTHPSEILSVGDIVKVYVYEIDEARGRVQLSLLPKEAFDKKTKYKKSAKDRKAAKQRKKQAEYDRAIKRMMRHFGQE